mmetsp:Transcript_11977/g.35965  ORF Transcript_11977/g.35965 Transcript_11977/m.35965 type:complete len:310 (-) Transcript_11977:337-1266(-)
MPLLQLADLLLDGVPSGLSGTGGIGGVVDVAASTVPVAGHGLGVKGGLDVVQLAHTVQQEPRHPQLVRAVNACARAHLVLPLCGHDLGVGAADVDAGVHARLHMCLHHVTGNGRPRPDGAVVRALGAGETALGPAKRALGEGVEEGVLLLDAKPGLLGGGLLHGDVAVVPVVGRQRHNVSHARAILLDAGGLEGVTEHQDVVTAAERVLVDHTRLQEHLGVVTWSLVGGRAIVVPGGQVLGALGDLVQHTGLAPQVLLRAADPDVLGHDLASLVEVCEPGRVDGWVNKDVHLPLGTIHDRKRRHVGLKG